MLDTTKLRVSLTPPLVQPLLSCVDFPYVQLLPATSGAALYSVRCACKANQCPDKRICIKLTTANLRLATSVFLRAPRPPSFLFLHTLPP